MTASSRRVVDVHHHFLPQAVFDTLKEAAGGAARLVNERLSLTLSADLPDVDTHLGTMAEAGVDAAVLTYSGVSTLGADVCRLLNDGMASVQQAHSGVLYGSAHAYLKDPNAPQELERAIIGLGLVAISLPTSEGEMGLDDASLEPLWTAIETLNKPVILHPTLLPRGAPTDYGLERACARPFDTTVAAVRLAYGVLPRHPGLRVVLPHVGGTTVFLHGRLAMFYAPAATDGGRARVGMANTVRERAERGLQHGFDSAWSQFYLDTAGTGGWSPAVEMGVRVVGAERLLFGSDYPLESHSSETVRELVDMIDGLPVSPAEQTGILGRNAAALFGLP
ncbi:MAG: amidohydrolase family protein [Chloroflexota bacterium]